LISFSRTERASRRSCIHVATSITLSQMPPRLSADLETVSVPMSAAMRRTATETSFPRVARLVAPAPKMPAPPRMQGWPVGASVGHALLLDTFM
jgi:hypothetical protein